MIELNSLNKNFSATRILHKLLSKEYLDENGRIKSELKFKIDLPLFNLQDSKLIGKPEDVFETVLFLPEGEQRKIEGGLRTKGYFKFSYKKLSNNGKDDWHICDLYGNTINVVSEDIEQNINQYVTKLLTDENKSLSVEEIKELPLVTVITVVFNGAKYLEETIMSVINQDYPNMEYIIIDGGSTDSTIDIIHKYEYAIDYWVSEKDSGIYDAMNKGIKLAMGLWVGILGSDDFYEYKAINNFILSGVYRHKSVNVFYGNSNVLFEDKLLYRRMTTSNIKKINSNFIFFHPDSIVQLDAYKRAGLYDTNFKLASDYEFFLRLYFNGYKLRKISHFVLNYRLGGFSSNYNLVFIENLKLFNRYKFKLSPLFLLIMLTVFIKSFIKDVFHLKHDSVILMNYRKIRNFRNIFCNSCKDK